MKLQKPRYVYSDTFLVQKPRDAIHNQHAIFLRILPGRIVDAENIARSGGAHGAVVLIWGRQTRVKSCSNEVMPLKMNEVHHAPINIPFIVVSDSYLVSKDVTYEVNSEPSTKLFCLQSKSAAIHSLSRLSWDLRTEYTLYSGRKIVSWSLNRT